MSSMDELGIGAETPAVDFKPRPKGCDERVLDIENLDSNMASWNSEFAGDYGTIPCGAPVVWGNKCERHKVERRKGGDRRKAVSA